ncbi:hypothetical protein AGMMS49975_08730 [Clostridia bacterium]|nr:hypothetical protein AGMMS49975_08730 [Clostridia bacterium]
MRNFIKMFTVISCAGFVISAVVFVLLPRNESVRASETAVLTEDTASVFAYNEEIEYTPKHDGFFTRTLNTEPGSTVYKTDDIPDLSEFLTKNPDFSREIFYKENATPALNRYFVPPSEYLIGNVPKIVQNPELPRGCEVTSLTMLMNYFGVQKDKLSFAAELKKNDVPRTRKGGYTYWGDPNDGFIGDMYNMRKAGLGVYHAPIFELLYKYFGDSAVDLTGADFGDLIYQINNNSPVWVIVNSNYKTLAPRDFETWDTPNGEIKITYKEHSVLITGYDEKYIYFNDPLDSYTRVQKENFIACWEQMGKQAVTVLRD